MKRLFSVLLVLGLGILLVTGCAQEQAPSNGNGAHGLGWALNIANGIRDTQLPGAKLNQIAGSYVNINGEITQGGGGILEGGLWSFSYYKGNDEFLAVNVYYDHPTDYHDPGGAMYLQEIPPYMDAAAWVQAADSAIAVTFISRAVQVFADAEDWHPTADNLAIIYYYPDDPPRDHIVEVHIDADTSTVLGVYPGP